MKMRRYHHPDVAKGRWFQLALSDHINPFRASWVCSEPQVVGADSKPHSYSPWSPPSVIVDAAGRSPALSHQVGPGLAHPFLQHNHWCWAQVMKPDSSDRNSVVQEATQSCWTAPNIAELLTGLPLTYSCCTLCTTQTVLHNKAMCKSLVVLSLDSPSFI